MKNWLKNRSFSDWAFATVVVVVLFLRGPLLIEQFRHEGKSLAPTLVDGKLIPPPNEKSVLIFWASWCGPCSVELGRINSAISKGEISTQHIYAVNMGEERAVIERTIREKIPFSNYQGRAWRNGLKTGRHRHTYHRFC